jgi:ech hydrogenase subunit C
MNGLTKSPWILHYDASSCNGCDIETLACLTPVFDVERLGVVNTGNPKHADIFLVTGAVNRQSKVVIQNLYRQLPEPKVVVAVGACASSGGIFHDCYNILGGVDHAVPVDVFVPGCAARPEAIIDGVVKGLAVMQEKQAALASLRGSMDKIVHERAAKADAPLVHALRATAGRMEAVLHHDESFPVLKQTLEELEKEFETKTFMKATINGRIVGTISGWDNAGVVNVAGLAVHPYFQETGLAKELLKQIEAAVPGAGQFETMVGDKNERLHRDLGQSGYRDYKTEVFTPGISWIFLRKERA